MIQVTELQFYHAIGGPENIHPSPFPDHSEWKNLNTHAVVGRSEPGYKGAIGAEKKFLLEEKFAAAKGLTP